MENIDELLSKGYVIYQKDGKIEIEQPPRFGYVTLHYQDGKFTFLEKLEPKR